MKPDPIVPDDKVAPIGEFNDPPLDHMADLHRKVVADLKLSPTDKAAERAAALEIVRAARHPGKDAKAAVKSAKRAASKIIDKSDT